MKRRKNPVGLVLPLLGAGAAAVLAIVLVTRKGKEEPPTRTLDARRGMLAAPPPDPALAAAFAKAAEMLKRPGCIMMATPPYYSCPPSLEPTSVLAPGILSQYAAFSVRGSTDSPPPIDPMTGEYAG
jgi:hypothetical protein